MVFTAPCCPEVWPYVVAKVIPVFDSCPAGGLSTMHSRTMPSGAQIVIRVMEPVGAG